jgi:hypothetical protein
MAWYAPSTSYSTIMLLYIVYDNTCISKNIIHIKVELEKHQQKLLLFNAATSNIQ